MKTTSRWDHQPRAAGKTRIQRLEIKVQAAIHQTVGLMCVSREQANGHRRYWETEGYFAELSNVNPQMVIISREPIRQNDAQR